MNKRLIFAAAAAGLLNHAVAAQTNTNEAAPSAPSEVRGSTSMPSIPAERTIFLDASGFFSFGVSVAYHPTFQRFYSSNSGSTSATGLVFGENGGAPISTISPLNIDPRGWFFNNNTDQLEISTFDAIAGGTDRGLVAPGIDMNGDLTGTLSILLPSLPGLASSQTSPHYNAVENVLNSRGNSEVVNVVDRSDGSLVNTITLDFAAAGMVDPLRDGILFIPTFQLLGVVDGDTDAAAFFDLNGDYLLSVQFDFDLTDSSRRPSFANNQIFVFDSNRSGWQGYEFPADQRFNDRFESFTLNQTGDWICDPGEICQDVFEVEVAEGSVVSIDLTAITGNSDARIAALRPGASLDASNVILARSSDYSCAGQDADEHAGFVADIGGRWQVVVGRDWSLSGGNTGTYALEVQSNQAFLSDMTLEQSDVTSQADNMRCRGEYRITGNWNCSAGESCQDAFSLSLETGSRLALAATELTGNSVPRFALHAPGVPLGDINLLTNTTEDRECVGQDQDDRPPAYPVRETGTHTLALTRDWGSSAGASGSYALSISAGEGVFSTPILTLNDFNSPAPGSRCGWRWESASNWSCLGGEDCQDVYDLELDSNTTPQIEVTDLTGSSVARLALFEPSTPLSGTNLLTGTNLDYSCGGQDVSETPAPITLNRSGTYQLAVGRDWGSSAGASGSYLASLVILDGYGGAAGQTVDDTQSLSGGLTCP